jgi:hypothetical protein
VTLAFPPTRGEGLLRVAATTVAALLQTNLLVAQQLPRLPPPSELKPYHVTLTLGCAGEVDGIKVTVENDGLLPMRVQLGTPLSSEVWPFLVFWDDEGLIVSEPDLTGTSPGMVPPDRNLPVGESLSFTLSTSRLHRIVARSQIPAFVGNVRALLVTRVPEGEFKGFDRVVWTSIAESEALHVADCSR